jgi:hypothetical protein
LEIEFPQPEQTMFCLIKLDSCDHRTMTWQSSGGFLFTLFLSGGVSSKALLAKERLVVEARGEAGITGIIQ